MELQIHKMEINAGYYFDVMDVDGLNTGIYLFKSAFNFQEVPNGDWVEYFGSKI
jgi:hypothetical protein